MLLGMPARGFLVINPRSGDSVPSADELAAAARERGLTPHVLAEDEDAGEIARAADADALGVAGGDGSLGAVAAIAVERRVPLACIPFGTRNHFARDLGLDPADPIGAMDAFDGVERRVDVGRAGDTTFLNNVSLGLYARLVHERERHRLRSHMLASARALWLTARNRHPVALTIDGSPTAARVVLVANNRYRLDLFSPTERASLDAGRLYLYEADGLLPGRWRERAGDRFVFDAGGGTVPAAVDGDLAKLGLPLEFRIEPRGLRVLVPRAPG
jgi:diacylglycerol kinase family enzyme